MDSSRVPQEGSVGATHPHSMVSGDASKIYEQKYNTRKKKGKNVLQTPGMGNFHPQIRRYLRQTGVTDIPAESYRNVL